MAMDNMMTQQQQHQRSSEADLPSVPETREKKSRLQTFLRLFGRRTRSHPRPCDLHQEDPKPKGEEEEPRTPLQTAVGVGDVDEGVSTTTLCGDDTTSVTTTASTAESEQQESRFDVRSCPRCAAVIIEDIINNIRVHTDITETEDARAYLTAGSITDVLLDGILSHIVDVERGARHRRHGVICCGVCGARFRWSPAPSPAGLGLNLDGKKKPRRSRMKKIRSFLSSLGATLAVSLGVLLMILVYMLGTTLLFGGAIGAIVLVLLFCV